MSQNILCTTMSYCYCNKKEIGKKSFRIIIVIQKKNHYRNEKIF